MRKRFCILAAFGGSLALAAWFSWQRFTTPGLPEITLDRADPALFALVEAASEDVRKEPRSAQAWGRLGLILTANELPGPALICFAHAERFDPADPRWPYLRGVWYLFGRPHEAIELFRRALARARTMEQKASILFQLVRAEVEQGLLGDAEEHLQAIASLSADTPQEHLGRALLAEKRGDTQEARKHLELLTENPFTRKRACTLLVALTANDRDVAERYRQRAAALPADMSWPDAILSEMNVYIVNRDSQLRQARTLLSAGEVAKARDLAHPLVRTQADAEATLLLADCLRAGRDYEEAGRLLRSLIEAEPDNAPAHMSLGQMLLRQGEELEVSPECRAQAETHFRQATDQADKVLRANRNHAEAYLLRGRSLQHLGNTAEAITAYSKAVACRPDLAVAHQALGEALAAADRVPEALEYLENAQRLSLPNDPRPREALEKWKAKASGGAR